MQQQQQQQQVGDLYEKRSETVAAFQWTPEMGEFGGVISARTFAEVAYGDNPNIRAFLQSDSVFVVITAEGPATVLEGDYVISHKDGTQSVEPEDIFNKNYGRIGD